MASYDLVGADLTNYNFYNSLSTNSQCKLHLTVNNIAKKCDRISKCFYVHVK